MTLELLSQEEDVVAVKVVLCEPFNIDVAFCLVPVAVQSCLPPCMRLVLLLIELLLLLMNWFDTSGKLTDPPRQMANVG